MNEMTCVVCGKKAKKAKLRFQGYSVDGWKCPCGEEYFEPGQAQRILVLNKLRQQETTAKLGKVRSNLILRIPTDIADALGLKEGERVKLRVHDKNLCVSGA